MALELVPRHWMLPTFHFPTLADFDAWDIEPRENGGLTISADDKNVFIEAALPGVDTKDIDVTFDKGRLLIRGEGKEEEKGKKFYRKAQRTYSYSVTPPVDVEQKKEPEATYKNGVMSVTFTRSPASQPKKLAVKTK